MYAFHTWAAMAKRLKSETRNPRAEGNPRAEVPKPESAVAPTRQQPAEPSRLRFVLAKLNPKWVQLPNRGIHGIRGKIRLRMCPVSAYSVYSAVVPGRLWFWLRQVRISSFGLPSALGSRPSGFRAAALALASGPGSG